MARNPLTGVRLHFWSSDRSLSALLALLVLTLLASFPLSEVGAPGTMIINLLFSLLLVSGVMSVTTRRTVVFTVGVFAAASFTLRWAAIGVGGVAIDTMAAASSGVFCALLAAVVFAKVFSDGEVTLARIQGAIAAYMLLGLMWGSAYEVIALHHPGAFRLDTLAPLDDRALQGRLIYFSFATLTTVGYGDVTAVHPLARSFAILEALTGQLYPAILIGGLISLVVDARSAHRRGDR